MTRRNASMQDFNITISARIAKGSQSFLLPPRLQQTITQRTHLFKALHEDHNVLFKTIGVTLNPSLHQGQRSVVHTHVGPSVATGREALSKIVGEVPAGNRITLQLP